jgi:hypothetical protein
MTALCKQECVYHAIKTTAATYIFDTKLVALFEAVNTEHVCCPE